MTRAAVFAIPGDLATRSGGYAYERHLLWALRRSGWDVQHLALPGSYPDPTPGDLDATAAALAAVAPGTPVLLDGFLPGATPPERLAALRAPFVAVSHHPLCLETGLAPERAAWLRATEAANLARAAHVLVPSPHTKRVLEAEFGLDPARVTVATPGLPRPPPAPARPANPVPRILCVGLVHPRKGHDVLIAALARLRGLAWEATIVGPTRDEAHARALRDLRDGAGLAGRLHFAGEVDDAALEAAYARADLFALATRYEGYGIVFAEAMARGLPVVACATGAVPDTVPPAAGLLVPPDDPGALAAALARLLADPAERAARGRAAARHAASLPTWDETAAIAGAVLDAVRDAVAAAR